MRKARSLAAAALFAAVVGVAAATPAAAAPTFTYEVTITDLTSGQPLTPPVVATTGRGVAFFRVGGPASVGVQQIAENGNNGPLLDALTGKTGVSEFVQAGNGPLVPPGTPGSASFGDSVTFTITAGSRARFLSYVAMLICTNDGFTGANRVPLPGAVGQSITVETAGYDAGTEINTEDLADIVPPCQGLIGVTGAGIGEPGDTGTGTTNPALAEGGLIHHHGGILGVDDLVPATHGWNVNAPVAEITITRVA